MWSINEFQIFLKRDVTELARSDEAGGEVISISISEPEDRSLSKDIEKLIHQRDSRVIVDNPFPQTGGPMNAKEKRIQKGEKWKEAGSSLLLEIKTDQGQQGRDGRNDRKG